MQTAIFAALARIQAVDWLAMYHRYGEHRSNSDIALLQEYLRRAARWAQALGLDLDAPSSFYAALGVAPAVPEKLLDQIVEHTEPAFYWAKIACVWYIYWVSIADQPQVRAYDLPNPYEPLLRIYERGGSFKSSKIGGWEVGYATIVRRPGWGAIYAARPAIALDDATLDAVDEQARRQRLKPRQATGEPNTNSFHTASS